ncbi:MAG: hypothetical protein ABI432_09620 [Flavobacteriales bacterium]
MIRTLRTITSFALTSLVVAAHAQNPVPNPSFDVQTACPLVSEIELAPPWYAPTAGTPDLFNSTCPTQNGPGHSGIGSSGVFTHGEGAFLEYREYVQAPLITPLVAGQGYCVSLWVKRANFRYATDRFGVLFSATAVSLANTNALNYTPQVQNTPGDVLSDAGWMEISGGFVAQGGEAYVTIGSFANSAGTTAEVVNAASTSTVAFYYFDDVVVTPCAVGIEEQHAQSFDVFPMPAVGQLTVRMPPGVRMESARLLDTKGSVMRNYGTIPAVQGAQDLDITGLANGLCHLVITTDHGTLTRTVILGE